MSEETIAWINSRSRASICFEKMASGFVTHFAISVIVVQGKTTVPSI